MSVQRTQGVRTVCAPSHLCQPPWEYVRQPGGGPSSILRGHQGALEGGLLPLACPLKHTLAQSWEGQEDRSPYAPVEAHPGSQRVTLGWSTRGRGLSPGPHGIDGACVRKGGGCTRWGTGQLGQMWSKGLEDLKPSAQGKVWGSTPVTPHWVALGKLFHLPTHLPSSETWGNTHTSCPGRWEGQCLGGGLRSGGEGGPNQVNPFLLLMTSQPPQAPGDSSRTTNHRSVGFRFTSVGFRVPSKYLRSCILEGLLRDHSRLPQTVPPCFSMFREASLTPTSTCVLCVCTHTHVPHSPDASADVQPWGASGLARGESSAPGILLLIAAPRVDVPWISGNFKTNGSEQPVGCCPGGSQAGAGPSHLGSRHPLPLELGS